MSKRARRQMERESFWDALEFIRDEYGLTDEDIELLKRVSQRNYKIGRDLYYQIFKTMLRPGMRQALAGLTKGLEERQALLGSDKLKVARPGRYNPYTDTFKEALLGSAEERLRGELEGLAEQATEEAASRGAFGVPGAVQASTRLNALRGLTSEEQNLALQLAEKSAQASRQDYLMAQQARQQELENILSALGEERGLLATLAGFATGQPLQAPIRGRQKKKWYDKYGGLIGSLLSAGGTIVGGALSAGGKK